MEKKATYTVTPRKKAPSRGGARKNSGRKPGRLIKMYRIGLTDEQERVLKIIGHGKRSKGAQLLIDEYTNSSNP